MPALDAGVHMAPPDPLFPNTVLRRHVDRRVVTFTAGLASAGPGGPAMTEKEAGVSCPIPRCTFTTGGIPAFPSPRQNLNRTPVEHVRA